MGIPFDGGYACVCACIMHIRSSFSFVVFFLQESILIYIQNSVIYLRPLVYLSSLLFSSLPSQSGRMGISFDGGGVNLFPRWEITPVFLLIQLKLKIIAALTHLGLYKPIIIPQQNHHHIHTSTSNHIFILYGNGRTSPSLKAAIKNWVPILHYREILDQQESEKEVLCTICLEKIQDNEQVRELIRCHHVFHRACLDKWIDSSQVTCPLCRSLLIPPTTNLFGAPAQYSLQLRARARAHPSAASLLYY